LTTPASSSLERVSRQAAALGLDISIRRMAQSTRTAGEAARACDCQVDQIVKSMVFEEKKQGALVLLLVSGAHDADIDFIRTQHGLDLTRADTRRVRDETGFAIGGVAPIGHLRPLPVYIDERLAAFETVWAAAGRPDSVFCVNPKVLAEAIGAVTIRMR